MVGSQLIKKCQSKGAWSETQKEPQLSARAPSSTALGFLEHPAPAHKQRRDWGVDSPSRLVEGTDKPGGEECWLQSHNSLPPEVRLRRKEACVGCYVFMLPKLVFMLGLKSETSPVFSV